ncbi:MAG: DUF4296 domain-containing protein [Bacteroidales bacterium]|nr:DUF4296 domain-containing protein [Bacteroidales bacterium]
MRKTPIIGAALLSLALLAGCEKRPEGVVSENKAVDVLTDLQLAEAYMDMHGGEYSSQEARRAVKLRILQDNGMSEEEFQSTIDWYGHNMDRYSKLYDKVYKRLESRRKDYSVPSSGRDEMQEQSTLWPYPSMTFFSHLTDEDAMRFSVSPSLARGEVLEWSMRLSKPASMEVTLGVDYRDGASSLVNRAYGGSRNIKVKLQTDSTRDVKRVYGVLRVLERGSLPLWADSISLITAAPTPTDYSYFSTQKNLLPPGKNNYRHIPGPSQEKDRQESASDAHGGDNTDPHRLSESAPHALPASAPSSGAFRPGAGSRSSRMHK